MGTTTETFTHADQTNNLTADNSWTTWTGSRFDIVSNQAKALGSNSTGAMCRMNESAHLGNLITAQVKLVTFTGGDASHAHEGRLFLQKDSLTTQTYYAWVARRDSAGDGFYMFKLVGGAFTQLGSTVLQTINANDVMAFTWNPATNDLKGYVNGTLILTNNDTAITANPYGGIGFDTNDPAGVVIMDDFSLTDTGLGQMWLK